MGDQSDNPPVGADRSEKALREFLSEAQEIVEGLGANLLGIDKVLGAGDVLPAGENQAVGAVEPERINACFRAVHSLKGLFGLFGLNQQGVLAHRLENLLDAIRLGKIEPSSSVLDLLFESVELFGLGLEAAARGGDLTAEQVDTYVATLEQALAGPASDTPVEADSFGGYELESSLLSVLTEYEEHRLRENIRLGAVIYQLHGVFDLMAIEQGIEEIKARVKPVGEILTYLPSGDSSDPDLLGLQILVASSAGDKTMAEVIQGIEVQLSRLPRRGDTGPVNAAPSATTPPSTSLASSPIPVEPGGAGVREVGVLDREPQTTLGLQAGENRRRMPARNSERLTGSSEPRPVAPGAAADGDGTDTIASLRSVSQSVRVDIRKLDALMNAVGELGLVQTGLNELLESLVEKRLVEESQALRYEVRALERKLVELQSGILEVRMVPLRQVFDKLSRVVRKVSRSLGKQIRLEISGADTELDKLIVEELSDPLMHIIRNAIDHGLETAPQRLAAGKTEVGTIIVRAFQHGNRVLVSVSDDGRGIDPERVAEAAVRRGLLEQRQVRDLSRREIQNLLFLPGMSTREDASEISGRGVGLDVVKTNIANLSGIIDITSTQGVGTQVTITLPITLAIIQAIIVRVVGRTYAVPLNSVVESLLVEHNEIRTVEGKEVVLLRSQTLRLVRVAEFFELSGSRDGDLDLMERGEVGNSCGPPLYVVVVGIAQHRVGLVVDELVGQQDIVIKSLGASLAGVVGIAGATELAGQRTVLVLDVPSLVDEAVGRTGTWEAA